MAEVYAQFPVQEPPEEAPPGAEPEASPGAVLTPAVAEAAPVDDAALAAELARAKAAALAAHFAASHNGEDHDGKRKFQGDDEDHAAKRLNSEIPISSYSGEVSEVIQVPSGKIGRLIGKQGATIKDIQARGGGRVKIDHETPGETRAVTVSGTAGQVALTKQFINEALDPSDFSNSGAAHAAGAPGSDSRKIPCPPHIVGRIIGRGGETIRSLQTASTAHIVINQNFPEGQPREIEITGNADAVARAHEMVLELINSEGAASTQTVIQKFGAGITRVIECPKPMVGRIIGKGGETVKGLQRQYAASIQIEQNTVPVKVTITGPPAAVASVERAIMDLIEDRPSGGQGGYGGGRPAFQPPFQPPYGGFTAPGYGAYGAGYGGYPGPAAFGFPGYAPQGPPAAYGGYGGYAGDPYAAAASAGYGAAAAGGYPGQQQQQAQQQQQQQQQPVQQQQQQQQPASGVWSEIKDDQDRSYYYNSVTGASQWERPPEMQ